MAIYGDQLVFFTEQFRMFDYFTMTPLNVSSYSKRENVTKVRGIFQYMKKGELEREEDTLADINVPTFWTRTKLDTRKGFIQKDEDELYRITNDYPWFFEGGYYCYGLEEFVGNSDTQEPYTEEEVDLGMNDYE